MAHRISNIFPRSVLIALGALTVGPASAQGQSEIVKTNVAVPMRDGVLLRADILLPDQGGPFPVLVYRTPYGKQNARDGVQDFRARRERVATRLSFRMFAVATRPTENSGRMKTKDAMASIRSSGPPGSHGPTVRLAPSDSRIPAPCSGSPQSRRRRI